MIDLWGCQLFESLIGRCLAIFTGQTSFFLAYFKPFSSNRPEKKSKLQTREAYQAPNSENDSKFYECILCFSHMPLPLSRHKSPSSFFGGRSLLPGRNDDVPIAIHSTAAFPCQKRVCYGSNIHLSLGTASRATVR